MGQVQPVAVDVNRSCYGSRSSWAAPAEGRKTEDERVGDGRIRIRYYNQRVLNARKNDCLLVESEKGATRDFVVGIVRTNR